MTVTELRQLAAAVRLDIPEEKQEKLRQDLTAILQNIDRLPQLCDAADTADAADAVPSAPLRADSPQPSLARQALLAAAPNTQDGWILAPKIIG